MRNTAELVAVAIVAMVVIFGVQHLAGKLGGMFARRRDVPTPDLASGRVIVTGWSAAEARTILKAFAKLYDLDEAIFAVSDAGEALEVRWKRPIASGTAFYLVNYLHYPMEFDLSGRRPEAVAVIAVPEALAPNGIASGTLVKVYVPEGDTEYDLVHALTPNDRAYRISFTRLKWERIDAPRASPLVQQVAFRDTAS